MKKYILSIVLVAILFAFSFERGEATCPAGYTSITAPIHIGSCDFIVEGCYKCSPTGVTDLIIGEVKTFTVGCDVSVVLLLSNWSFIEDQLMWTIMHSTGCFIQPCDQSPPVTFSFSTTRYICNKVYNYTQIIDKVETHWYQSLVPCDPGGAYCVRQFKICLDYSTTPPSYTQNYVSSYPVGTPACSAQTQYIPKYGDVLYDHYYETICFTSGCNN